MFWSGPYVVNRGSFCLLECGVKEKVLPKWHQTFWSQHSPNIGLSILLFLVKLVWVRASVYWLFCKALKNSMLSFYTNQLIIYLSMKKYFLFKKKLYKNLILCVIVFLRSSTTLAFAVWIIPTCSFSCDYNIYSLLM